MRPNLLICIVKDLVEAFIARNNKLYIENLVPETADEAKKIWEDPAMKKVVFDSKELRCPDSIFYFMDRIDEIAKPEYTPNDDDILRCRGKTSGVIETTFDVDGVPLRMVDVGGQRTERKKWMHCFDQVTCVLYFISLSEYNQTLHEDMNTLRTKESQKVCNVSYFHNYLYRLKITILLSWNG